MQLTILGCSGSLGAPGNPASSYVISVPGETDVVMDFGPGALAAMQERFDPAAAHVVFSHLHADHCSDFPSLLVWRRYHPTAPATERHRLIGPSYAPEHFGHMSADGPGELDDISDTFDFTAWRAGQPEHVSGLTITPFDVVHPAQESHALRIEDDNEKVITFSGDSGWTPTLIDAARAADLFLCEAAWGATSEGKTESMHLSGREAGRIAQQAGVKTLVLVHIQPWANPQEVLAAARAEFDGEIVLGVAGATFDV
ncbi:MBL fold metallo-hydrolase [Corynebacterium mucifaciens]|nr:MBL fold metallo-hydrolase [Corynebacterium mucifaciens]